TGAGGIIQSILMGFGGLDITPGGIVQIRSSLPKEWKKLTITGVGPAMKTIAVILLMSVLLFNWYGYRFVADYFENRADYEMQAKLDINNYAESDLISIKVPLSLPYGPNSKNFEKVEGNIEIKGVSYQYVKRRFYNDTLELLCIPNTAKTTIKNAKDEFSKMA